MTGIILNIQHYAVHDGPGIRTLVFLKGCPLRCSWCCNPESQSVKPQVRYISFRCKACLECAKYCPASAISFKDGIVHHSFDNCISCYSKACIEKCNYEALSLSGKEMDSAELTRIISLDIPFYRNSGGGVTFSGGEPLMHPEFLCEVLQKCKELNIHTAVETCGWADRNAFRQILPFTDLFLYDLKLIDPELHLTHTGKPVGPILENLAFLASENADIIIRVPLIPGITDTAQNLESIAAIMDKHSLKRICLEPYHTLGREKYGEHGMNYHLDHISHHNPQQIKIFSDFFGEQGLYCEIS
jgi:pyruvate formate lyase activating enzyme